MDKFAFEQNHRAVLAARSLHTSYDRLANRWQEWDPSSEIEDRTGDQALTDEQTVIVEYVLEARDQIRDAPIVVLLQAGPGRGKTFLTRRLLEKFRDDGSVPLTVIMTHNMLDHVRYTSRTLTSCSFFMKMFALSIKQLEALEKQVLGTMTADEFAWTYFRLVQKGAVHLPAILGESKFIVFDEYTVLPKVFLQVLLDCIRLQAALLSDKIFMFLGDYNQLKSIGVSLLHTKTVSSYELISRRCTRKFTLTKNLRCRDPDMNACIDLFTRLSDSRALDPTAFLLLSGLFFDKMYHPRTLDQTHISSVHRLLTEVVQSLVTNERIKQEEARKNLSDEEKALTPLTVAVSDYMIAPKPSRSGSACTIRGHRTSTSLYYPDATSGYASKSGNYYKFLPYQPLIVSQRYYYKLQRNKSVYELISINLDQTEYKHNDTITLRKVDTGDVLVVPRRPCGSVMHPEHEKFILEGDPARNYCEVIDGVVVNFPIYPIMTYTTQRVQGETVYGKINMILDQADYDMLYVMITRVIERDAIDRLEFSGKESFLLTIAMNFPEIETCVSVPLKSLLRRIVNIDADPILVYQLRAQSPTTMPILTQLVEFSFMPAGPRRSASYVELTRLVAASLVPRPHVLSDHVKERLTLVDPPTSSSVADICTLDYLSSLPLATIRSLCVFHPIELRLWLCVLLRAREKRSGRLQQLLDKTLFALRSTSQETGYEQFISTFLEDRAVNMRGCSTASTYLKKVKGALKKKFYEKTKSDMYGRALNNIDLSDCRDADRRTVTTLASLFDNPGGLSESIVEKLLSDRIADAVKNHVGLNVNKNICDDGGSVDYETKPHSSSNKRGTFEAVVVGSSSAVRVKKRRMNDDQKS